MKYIWGKIIFYVNGVYFEKTLKSIPVTMLTTLTRKEEAKYILRVCHTQELASGWSNVSKK